MHNLPIEICEELGEMWNEGMRRFLKRGVFNVLVELQQQCNRIYIYIFSYWPHPVKTDREAAVYLWNA